MYIKIYACLKRYVLHMENVPTASTSQTICALASYVYSYSYPIQVYILYLSTCQSGRREQSSESLCDLQPVLPVRGDDGHDAREAATDLLVVAGRDAVEQVAQALKM